MARNAPSLDVELGTKSSTAGDEHLPKASAATRIAKKLGLTDARALLIRRELERALPGTAIDKTTVKRLAVFPKLGVVYNRIQKNANTTTMLLLDSLEVGKVRSIPESKGQHLLFYRAWLTGRFSLAQARYMVVVRSPYSRALSSFLFKFEFFGDVAMRRYGQTFNISPAGFEDFLRWLRDGALGRDLHWDLQLNSLALPVGVFTDIIHMERYEADMRQFLAQVPHVSDQAAARLDFAALRKIGSPHATRAQDKRGDYFTPAARALVSEIFARDFEAFGYAPD
ncbi:sulfotransferase family 2 domain-containing protein [Aestuariivirga sp.]|uniref:sulfotransferase family 2 domain-containing protein n=1 Tax=Aestuariivirga sp. TaxID=2650926 RepID=UPI003BAC8F30